MKNKSFRPFWWQYLLLGLTVLLIFTQSAMSPRISSSESGFVTRILYPILLRILGPEADLEHFVRKAGHFTEFFLLGLQLCLIWLRIWRYIPQRPSDAGPDRPGLLTSYPAFIPRAVCPTFGLTFACSSGVSWLIAFLDETVQIFSGRGPMIQDVWLDLAGALCAILLVLLVYALRQKSR
ncbi:MAG: VanZ family protein [Firmicutes bacterium]|nr:VanZ family protein [Bacillota bacterium]